MSNIEGTEPDDADRRVRWSDGRKYLVGVILSGGSAGMKWSVSREAYWVERV